LAQTKIRRASYPELFARLALASGVGYMAAAYSISRWLTRPSRGKPASTPSDFGLTSERIHCRAADGIRLAGWVVEPSRPRASIALFHGLRGSRSHMLNRVPFLAQAGYRCVLFDHRAHGESGGKRTSFGFHERRDVAAVLDYIDQRWPTQKKAALGTSMGAAALCYAAEKARGCKALVIESCYHDVAAAFAARLQHGYPPWYQRLARGVIWITERRLGVRLAQLTPADHIGQLAPASVLVLTGTQDVHAPPAEVYKLFERCQGTRELCMIPGAAHKDICEVGGVLYRDRLLDFLDREMAS
jgi:pimeloyl-ACP methyl ester carboxylesterase